MPPVPSRKHDLWHVTDLPREYLPNGRATIVPLVDDPEDSYTMPIQCYIGPEGYLRHWREDGPDQYCPKADIRLMTDDDVRGDGGVFD